MATRTTDTVENILQTISDLRGESTTNTDADRIRAVSRAYELYNRRRLWLVHRRSDQTLTGDGTNDYTVGTATYPMRHKGVAEVFVDGTTEDKRHSLVDYFTFKNLYNRNNATKLVYEWYDQENDDWKVHINPAPESGAVITYSYFYFPPKITATTDTLVCGDMDIIVNYAMSYIYKSEEEDDLALVAKNEAEQAMLEQEGLENMPGRGQLYAQSSIENQVSAHGIGTY